MAKDGHLRIKYVIEENIELKEDTTAMNKQDYTVQTLIGDRLKQD
jgi:hypothetical protein